MSEEMAEAEWGHEPEAAMDYPNKRACIVPHESNNLTPLPAWCSQDFSWGSQHNQDSWPDAVMEPSFDNDSRLDDIVSTSNSSYTTLAEDSPDTSRPDSEVTELGAPTEAEIELPGMKDADGMETCYGTVSVKRQISVLFEIHHYSQRQSLYYIILHFYRCLPIWVTQSI